jgi:hypothetical protein
MCRKTQASLRVTRTRFPLQITAEIDERRSETV